MAAGLGWGMVPAGMLARTDADLCQLRVGGTVEVPLFWHRWRIESPTLDHLSRLVSDAARVHLRQG